MGLSLNFGAGPNQLPAPWQNLNAEHDIRKPLKFADASTGRILVEHVIEHVPFQQGFGFLVECKRILMTGGVLRLSFPDPAGLLAVSVDTAARAPIYTLGERCATYAGLLVEHGRRSSDLSQQFPEEADKQMQLAMVMMLQGWGHSSVWTLYGAAAALLAVGFRAVRQFKYGEGELGECDGHHKTVGHAIAIMETTVLEATK